MATKSLTLDGLTYFYSKIKSLFQKDVNIWRGSCDTAAGTAAKAVTCSGFTSDDLVKGTIIFVTFSATNSATVESLTMSVNGTTAKPIKKQYNTSSASNLASAGELRANSTYLFQYDGTNWVCMTLDYNSTYANYSFGNGYAVQSNTSASTAITATYANYALTTNGIVAVKFNYDVPANATLNINSKGAKAIYYKEAAITAGVIKAGDIATFVYSTNYKLLSVDRWQENDFVVVDITTSSMNESRTSGTVSFGTKKYSELQADINSGKSVILRLDSSYLIPYIGWEADPPMYQFSSFVNLVFFVGTIWISASQGDNDSITGLFTFGSLPLDSNVVHKGEVGSSAEVITADKVFSGNVEFGGSLFVGGGASSIVMGNDESDDTLQDVLDAKADDNGVVHLAGAETVSGVKTFTNGLKLNTADSWASSDRPIPFTQNADKTIVQYVNGNTSTGLTYNPYTGAVKAKSFVTRGGTSSQFVKGDGSLDSRGNLLPNGKYFTPYNGFSSPDRRLYIHTLDNYLASYKQRAAYNGWIFSHKVYDSEGNFKSNIGIDLFDGNYEKYVAKGVIEEDDIVKVYLGTVEIDSLSSSSPYLTVYGAGIIFISFYAGTVSKEIPTFRIYEKNNGWLSYTPVLEKDSNRVYTVTIPHAVTFPCAIEITYIGKVYSNVSTSLNQIEWQRSRPYLGQGSGVDTYPHTQNLWGNLVAPRLVTRGATSSQFLKGDGSLDSTTYAPKASPALTGTPTAPTAAAGTNTTQIATTAFVQAAVSGASGSGAMLVTMTQSGGIYSLDKTFAEITTALSNEQDVVIKYGNYLYRYLNVNGSGSAIFTASDYNGTEPQVKYVSLSSGNTVSVGNTNPTLPLIIAFLDEDDTLTSGTYASITTALAAGREVLLKATMTTEDDQDVYLHLLSDETVNDNGYYFYVQRGKYNWTVHIMDDESITFATTRLASYSELTSMVGDIETLLAAI